ncbi:hypothetical protein GGI20_001877 [Coemansia sp. BCRC 34301]|nr:hypothetical protein GGI20_001877 [Coemansia sp. BCRC 34301]
MTIALAVAVVPEDTPMTIHSDSKAALKITDNLFDIKDIKHEYEKSNISYLAAWVRPWFQERTADTFLKWVKGHSGIRGNGMADKAAEKAYADEVPWTTRLSRPPDAPLYRLCVGNQLAPMTAGRLTRRQDEMSSENYFVYNFVRAQKAAAAIAAAPTADPVPAQTAESAVLAVAVTAEPAAAAPTTVVQPEDRYKWERKKTRLFAKSIKMARNKKGGWSQKNSWRTTNRADYNRRTFGIKVGYGIAATLDRQYLYWLDAYPEEAMGQCPRRCGQRESQAHMLACTANTTVQPPLQKEIEERFGKASAQVGRGQVFQLLPSMLVTKEWTQDVKETTEKENRLRKGKPAKKNRGPTMFATNMQLQIELQIVERLEYIYDRWKERSSHQIEREEQSAIKPLQRRQIMRRQQTTERSRDNRAAAVPPIARQWGDDLLDFGQVVLTTIALELRVIAYVCRVT